MSKFRLVSVFFLGMVGSSALAGNYHNIEYCDNGQIVQCVVGPYAHECTYTGVPCSQQSFCFDPRATFFQCKEGTIFRSWIQGDCPEGLVAGGICVDRN